MPPTSTSPTGLSLLRVIAAAAVLFSLATSAPAQSAQGGPANRIVISQMSFAPAQTTAKVGEALEWKNEDIFAHTVTADDGSFDSGLIAPGQSWKLTVKDTGTFRYHCRPHPNMTAGLVVSSAAEGAKPNAAQSSSASESRSQSLKWAPPTLPEEIHPILVNFTAALLPLSLLSDLLGRLFRRQSLHGAAWWMVLYAAAITPLTVGAGWWWKHAAGAVLPARLITIHQWLGTFAAVLFIMLAVWRWSIHKRGVPPSVAYLLCAFVAVLALVYQGSLGGRMLFGH